MDNIVTTTPWFSGDEKPMADRQGLYERDYSSISGGQNNTYWCWWDGEFFGNGASFTNAKKIYDSHGKSFTQSLPWRGVMK